MIEISCADAAAVFPLFMQSTAIIKSTGIPVLQGFRCSFYNFISVLISSIAVPDEWQDLYS